MIVNGISWPEDDRAAELGNVVLFNGYFWALGHSVVFLRKLQRFVDVVKFYEGVDEFVGLGDPAPSTVWPRPAMTAIHVLASCGR